MNSLEQIEAALLEYLKKTFNLSQSESDAFILSLNDDPKKGNFGDLSSNIALVIGNTRKEQPRRIAETITTTFSHPLIASSSIAGPGFINFTLTNEFFSNCRQELTADFDSYFKLPSEAPRYVFSDEFVSANPTGPLHLGHGRGGIIGDVLGNILRFVGHQVTKEFYINDAGKQIETLGLSFKIRCQQELGLTIELPEDSYQGTYLIDLAKECLAEDRIKVEEALATNEDTFFKQYAKNKLLAHITETLARYGIHFDVWFSEKTLHESGATEKALQLLTERGNTYEQDGALWFRSTAFGDDKDRVLRRSSGTITYVAADVAYILNKIERGAQKLIMVLGQDHHSYVHRLKGVMSALGYNPDNLSVILYQLVTLKEEGEVLRMSKRAGRIVSLAEIIEAVGTDVARFFYLNRKPEAHLEFDVALALERTEQNPVFYLQYAFVRTNSILEKAAPHTLLQSQAEEDFITWEPAERLLLKKIVALKRLLAVIGSNYQPHLLTFYVLELAHQFHSFYAEHQVIDLDRPSQSRRRLALVSLLQNTFKLSFALLGISAPEKM
ncbi:MAG: arginine--tRNA ligase [Candidatus Babeliaceae bacterium]|nr:arginine--tRNA ligase [Candidatus Babeliaceae bacterium]